MAISNVESHREVGVIHVMTRNLPSDLVNIIVRFRNGW